MTTGYRVGCEHLRGSARDLHQIDPIDQVNLDDQTSAAVVWCDYAAPALVLGSRQPAALAALDVLQQRQIELAVRRSGGGAVLMIPGDLVWIDLVARPGVFVDDVRNSMVAAGRIWARALLDLGVIAPGANIEVYDGPMRSGAWGDLVCFAGVGAGEVLVDGHKLVGLSQRRTRSGVRISGAVQHRSLVAATVPLLAADLPVGEPPAAATIPSVDPRSVVESLASAFDA